MFVPAPIEEIFRENLQKSSEKTARSKHAHMTHRPVTRPSTTGRSLPWENFVKLRPLWNCVDCIVVRGPPRQYVGQLRRRHALFLGNSDGEEG